jgi:hypothetical protein
LIGPGRPSVMQCHILEEGILKIVDVDTFFETQGRIFVQLETRRIFVQLKAQGRIFVQLETQRRIFVQLETQRRIFVQLETQRRIFVQLETQRRIFVQLLTGS